MAATHTATSTNTFTVTDIANVVRQFSTDLKMIASSTRAMTEKVASEYGADMELLASEGYLKTVDVTLLNSGLEVRAARYQVDENTGSLKSERPGGVRWPECPNGHIRIVFTHHGKLEDILSTLGSRLKRNWGHSSADTSHSSLSSSGGRTYASNGWGLRREDWS